MSRHNLSLYSILAER